VNMNARMCNRDLDGVLLSTKHVYEKCGLWVFVATPKPTG